MMAYADAHRSRRNRHQWSGSWVDGYRCKRCGEWEELPIPGESLLAYVERSDYGCVALPAPAVPVADVRSLPVVAGAVVDTRALPVVEGEAE